MSGRRPGRGARRGRSGAERGELVVRLSPEGYRLVAEAGRVAAVLDVADRGDGEATRRFVADLLAGLGHDGP